MCAASLSAKRSQPLFLFVRCLPDARVVIHLNQRVSFSNLCVSIHASPSLQQRSPQPKDLDILLKTIPSLQDMPAKQAGRRSTRKPAAIHNQRISRTAGSPGSCSAGVCAGRWAPPPAGLVIALRATNAHSATATMPCLPRVRHVLLSSTGVPSRHRSNVYHGTIATSSLSQWYCGARVARKISLRTTMQCVANDICCGQLNGIYPSPSPPHPNPHARR